MARSKEPTESHDKVEGNGDDRPSLAKFKNLTKRLIEISREEVAEAERRVRETGRKRS
jgi:hypothetical protein